MSSQSAKNGKLTREEKRAEKRKKKGDKPGYFAQMKQLFTMTRKSDPNIGWILLTVALVILLVFLLVGVLLNNWITWLIIGVPVAALACVIILSRRAERAAFGQIEGQPGAAGAALSTLRRGWIVEEQPVAVNPRTQDLAFRALGRPGVVLVTEGPASRVNSLVAQEKKKLNRVAPNVPVHVIKSGNGEGQVPLKKITKTMKKYPKNLTQQEVHAVNNRLASLNKGMPMPKGVDPMKARPDRKGLRGR
ncbi:MULTISPECIES: DUF4191 domain-containing protein [Kocuria]|uniref:DUF4191 domain-containing protein n=1 Tax=uncultured Kocuria sp. TaxID=259305 RepID=UPI000661500E|nr:MULTISPECIES: DUF4191 domain-containing protein [Kocuria]MCT1366635.1 DUF4191 domain-containing protein [Rothia sp. p3-SID1597]